MGSSPSKPPRKISRPIPQNPNPAPTFLPYPSLAPLPRRPAPSRPTPEEDLAGRYGRILAANPIYAGARAPARREEPGPGPRAGFRFASLSEIGAVGGRLKAQPGVGVGGKEKEKEKKKKKKDGYGVFPAAEKGDYRGGGGGGAGAAPPTTTQHQHHQRQRQAQAQAQGQENAAAKAKQGARFGGTRQDRHGEWWVLLLADGRWYRSREMGLRGPGW